MRVPLVLWLCAIPIAAAGDEGPIPWPFFWIHAPKTGSTFGGVLAAALCSGLDKVTEFYDPHIPADQQAVSSTGHLMYRHLYASMFPFVNATVADLSTKAWIGKQAKCIARPPGGFSYALSPNKISYWGLGADYFAIGHGHEPRSTTDDRPVVFFTRDPASRLLSSFRYGGRPCQPRRGASDADKACSEPPPKDQHRDQCSSLRLQASMNGWQGCQMKLLLGRTCNNPHLLSAQDISRALAMIRNSSAVAFVGDTDLWNLSVCAFWARVYKAAVAQGTAQDMLPCPPRPFLHQPRLKHDSGTIIPLEANYTAVHEERVRRGAANAPGCDSLLDAVTHADVGDPDELLHLAGRERLHKTVKQFKEHIDSCPACAEAARRGL